MSLRSFFVFCVADRLSEKFVQVCLNKWFMMRMTTSLLDETGTYDIIVSWMVYPSVLAREVRTLVLEALPCENTLYL